MAFNPYDDALERLDQSESPRPAAPTNPYAETLTLQDQSREAALRRSLVSVAPMSPDRAARAQQLAQRLGMPPSVVLRNFDAIERRAKVADTPYAQMLRETPTLAAFVADDPERAAAVQDDLEPLGALEWLVTAPQRAFAQGMAQVEFGRLRSESLFRDLTVEERQRMTDAKAAMKAGGELGAAQSWFRGAITGTARQLPNLFGAMLAGVPRAVPMAVTAGTGAALVGQVGPQVAVPEEVITVPLATAAGASAGMLAGGAEFAFHLEAGLAYDEYLEFRDELGEPIDPAVAKAAALATGALNGGLEIVGLGALARSIPGIDKLTGLVSRAAIKRALRIPTVRAALADAMRTYGQTLTAETAVEMAQRTVTILSGELAKTASGLETQSVGEIATDVLAEGAGALQSFALLSLPGPTLSVARDIRRARDARDNVAFFTALGEGVAQSKTAQRLPAAAQAFIASATKDGPIESVYAPVDTWITYWQSQGVDPAEMATQVTGDADAYDLAVRTGSDLVIPTARYAVQLAGTDHNAFFATELRLGPDQMNARESQAFAAQLEADRAAAADVAPSASEQLQQRIVDLLVQGGRMPEGTATRYAELLRSTFESLAETEGVTPELLYERIGLQVERPDLDVVPPARPGGSAGATVPGEQAPAEAAAPAGAPAEPGAATAATLEPASPADVTPEPTPAATPESAVEAAAVAGAADRATLPDDGQAPVVDTPAGPSAGVDTAQARTGADTTGAPAQPVAVDPERPAVRRSRQPRAGDGRARTVPLSHQPRVDQLLADARERGFADPDDSLVALYLEAVDEAKAIRRELREYEDQEVSNTFDLLKFISDIGGFGIEREAGASATYAGNKLKGSGGYTGELEVLLEGLSRGGVIRKGKNAGKPLPRQFRRSGGIEGAPGIVVRKGGLTADAVFESVNEDPRWNGRWDSLADFMQAVADAVAVENGQMEAPGSTEYDLAGILENVLGVRPGTDWWAETPAAPAEVDAATDVDATPVDALSDEAFADAGETALEDLGGDTSFNVDEFSQSLFEAPDPNVPIDTLTTGEQQPRLPGDVGAVRDLEIQQPPIAPLGDDFTLTPPPETDPTQTTLFQSAPLTAERLQGWADELRAATGADLVAFDLTLTPVGDIRLTRLAVGRGARRAGLGTSVLRALTRFADAHGARLVLTPNQRDPELGTTSRARLVEFYRRFGFVENTGRRRDLSIIDGMYREPTLRAGAGGFTLGEARVTVAAGDAYQQDLFGRALEDEDTATAVQRQDDAGADAAGPDRDPAAALQRDDVAGQFATRTQLVTHTTRTLGAQTVVTAADAAAALEYLARGAQERFDGVVVDAQGRPLAIVGSFKGAVAESPAYPEILVAEAFRIRGAAGIWFVHNHPSGKATLSAADRRLNARLASMFDGTAITMHGLLAVGAGAEGARQFSHVSAAGAETSPATVPAAQGRTRVPAVEREFTATDKMGGPIRTVNEAMTQARALSGGAFGIVLLDTQHLPIGFVPVDVIAAGELRTEGRLDWLYRALSLAGPRAAILNAPGGPEATRAARNLSNALHATGVSVLDVIIDQDGTQEPMSMQQLMGGPLPLDGSFRQDRRGAIRFGANRQFTISLFAKADLSTFLHESGHLFLELFGDVVDRVSQLDPKDLTETQRRRLADYAAILQWLGVERRADITTAHHEQWARGFEAYLMEGKAPSLALRDAFSAFRAWLLGIYRSLRGLNVELSPEIRGVMDRLVATDQAIAEAEASGAVAPMFLSADQAGMSAEEFAAYQRTVADASRVARETLERQAMAEVQREQTAQWKARRAEIEQAVTAETHARPVYQALAAMQRGTQPDGGALVEGEETPPLKLSKAILVERYGADRLKRLPRPFVYAVDGGLDPDVVAQMFGFSSGDELLTAVEQAGPLRAVIAHETDRRMLAEHGSLLLDGTIHEQAQAAVANDQREQVIRAELSALWKQARGVGRPGQPAPAGAAIPPEALLRAAARQHVAATRIRELRPQVFWTAARRASEEATAAAARRDLSAAIAAKQRELYNLSLFREAQQARDDVSTRTERVKRLTTTAGRQRLGLAGQSYLDQVDGILDRFSFATVSQKALDRRGALAKWITSQEADGLPVELPDQLLEETRRVPYQELTYEAFVGVTDGLAQIAHLARLKNRLLKDQQKRELAEVAGAVALAIRESRAPSGQPRAARDRRPAVERHRLVESFFAAHRKLANLAQRMDGFRDGGPVWTALVQPLNAAGDREAEMNAAATRALGAIVEQAYPGLAKRDLYVKRHIPAIGQSLSKMERLMVALNWGNADNRQRIRDAEGWTDDQVATILDTLDARDVQFVQGIWDLLDSYWPEIAAKQRRVTGLAPTKVEAIPVTTRHGTLRGGYFPLKYDDRLSATAAATLDLDAGLAAKQAAYVRATTRRGHTQERKANVKLPVRLDFGVITEHLQQVIHDLSHHEALIDVSRVLGHREVQAAIYDRYGDVVYRQMKDAVRDVAFGAIPAANGFEKGMNHLRSGATIAGLGWNLTTALLQPIGLTQSMVRIGPTWVARGLYRWLRDAASMENSVRWISERSTFMRLRGQTQQREINEIRNAVGVNTGRLAAWVDGAIGLASVGLVTRQAIADSYFFLIQQMQRIADVPTWLGQYEKAMAAGETEARAVALADQAVIDAQGGGQIKDLAAVQRGGPMLKLWTNFYSFFNTTYNLAADATQRTQFRSPASVGRLAVDYMLLTIIPASLGYMVREAMRPDSDDDEDWFEGLVRENLAYVMGTLLGLRELSGAVQGYSGYEGPAGARAFATISRLATQAQQGEADAAFWRALNDSAGVLFHFPAGQVRRTVDGIMALSEGRTSNPFAVVTGGPR